MKKLLLAIAGTLILSFVGAAAPLSSCAGHNVTEAALQGPGGGCLAGGLLFLFFGAGSVTPDGANITAAQITISSAQANPTNSSEIDLGFHLSGLSGPGTTGQFLTGDIILLYEIIGGIVGIDQNWSGSAGVGGSVKILETACSAPFGPPATSGCTQNSGVVLGSLTGNINSGSPSFMGNCTVSGGCDGGTKFTASSVTYVKKDIQFNNGTITDFTNSAEVPEPMTLSLVGAGLLGLGLLRKKRS